MAKGFMVKHNEAARKLKYETIFASKEAAWYETGGTFTYGANGLTITENEAKGSVNTSTIGIANNQWLCKYITIPLEKNLENFELEFIVEISASSTNRMGGYVIALQNANSLKFASTYLDMWNTYEIGTLGYSVVGNYLYASINSSSNGVTRTVRVQFENGKLNVYRDSTQIATNVNVSTPFDIDNLKIAILGLDNGSYPIVGGKLKYLKLEEL